eukprot:jgi/Chlat1/7178/Chrsp57S06834
MACHTLNDMHSCWRTGLMGAVIIPDFWRFMSITRYQQIKCYFHLNDNSQRPSGRTTSDYKLWHILAIINTLRDTFKQYYKPGRNVTIDERTIPIRNKMCPIRIYNHSKPYKFSIEIFQACDSDTYYCYDFIVYDKCPRLELHTYVVQQLVITMPYVHHHFILDRGFTSPKLLMWLRMQGHSGTGTIVANRVGYPSHLITLDTRAEQGEHRFAIAPHDGLIAVCWKDKKPVFFLSTCHGESHGNVSRMQSDGREADVPAPDYAVVYNLHKDAVDQYDKYCLKTNYSIQNSPFLSNGGTVLVANMWVCFAHANPTYTCMEFVLELQEQLVHNTLDSRPIGDVPLRQQAAFKDPQGRFRGGHFPDKHPSSKQRWCLASGPQEAKRPTTGVSIATVN